jgi:hypothetical protein
LVALQPLTRPSMMIYGDERPRLFVKATRGNQQTIAACGQKYFVQNNGKEIDKWEEKDWDKVTEKCGWVQFLRPCSQTIPLYSQQLVRAQSIESSTYQVRVG